VLTLPTVDTPFTVCKELPENKGVLLPLSKYGPEKIFLPPLAVVKLKISSVFLPAYLFKSKEFTTGAILTAFVLRGPA
jgi:hypothetical protein